MTEKKPHPLRRRSGGDSRPGLNRPAALAATPALVAGAALLGGALLAGAPARAAGLATIQIVAERTTLRADGRSTAFLSAQVRDDRGAYVPDGTRVRFATTAGRLDTTVATTQNGVARVQLTAADIPGSAVVTVTLDAGDLQAAPATVTISFTTDASASETGTNWIRIDGAYVGYIADYRLVQANGRHGAAEARVSYRGLTIAADTLQVDVMGGMVVAQGNVTIQQGSGGETRQYNGLRYSLTQGEGVAEKLDASGLPADVQIHAGGARLEESPLPAGQPAPGRETWQLKDVSQGNVAVVSKSISISPGSQIQFRRATFWVNGEKTVTLPYHVMELQQNQLFREQVVGFGPSGLSVDFPLYYDMRPDGVGTLHLRHGAQVSASAYSTVPGWHADLEQAYSAKGGDGTVEVDNVAQGDWGLRIRHGQRLDPVTRGSLFLDFPNNRDLFVTTQVQRDFHRFTLNATGYGSRSPGAFDPLTGHSGPAGGTLRGQVYAEGTPRVFLGVPALRYALSAGTSRQSFYGFTEGSQGILSNDNIGMRLFTTPLPLARGTTFTQSVTAGQAWIGGSAVTRHIYSGPGSGVTLLGSSSLNRYFGRIGSGSLTYDYAQTPLGLGFSGIGVPVGRHRAGLNLNLGSSDKISLSVNATQGLDVPQTQVYSTLLLGLGGPWRGSITFTTSRYSSYHFQDAEFRIGRRVLGRDVDLYYSTTAKKFQLELAGVRF